MPDVFLKGHAIPCPTCAGQGTILEVGRDGWQTLRCPARCAWGRLAKPPEMILADMLAETRQGPGG